MFLEVHRGEETERREETGNSRGERPEHQTEKTECSQLGQFFSSFLLPSGPASHPRIWEIPLVCFLCFKYNVNYFIVLKWFLSSVVAKTKISDAVSSEYI